MAIRGQSCSFSVVVYWWAAVSLVFLLAGCQRIVPSPSVQSAQLRLGLGSDSALATAAHVNDGSKTSASDVGAASALTTTTPSTATANVVAMQYAIVVGTPDNPTIDGGVINSDPRQVGEVAILQPAPPNAAAAAANAAVAVVPAISSATTTSTFSDTWATSKRVKKVLEDAARHGKLAYVLQKSDEYGLPASVATVPIVESGYRDQVISPKGAAGAWQLMPYTAQAYGVTREERHKLVASTGAALSLLQQLHQQFKSWELAFAAYNAGAPRVQRALRQKPTATSVQELDLPSETKEYVARIMALNQQIAAL
jgi:hypothetical protein